MLVIISDLHFTDGTTSNNETDKEGKKIDLFNVNPNAFKMFFSRIADIVQKTNAKYNDPIKEVKFIYNGDIFDPLRSTEWFKPEVIQPWNAPTNDASVIATARGILEAIIEKNEMAFKWLRGDPSYWKAVWEDVVGDANKVKVERVYIPGNHDRILNLDAVTRTQIQKALGLANNKKFEHCFDDPKNPTAYRTLVMHGHEADKLNIEESGDLKSPYYYDQMPIGDPMTTMLFAKIGYVLFDTDLNIGDKDKAEKAKSRFREIDNVRPASAVGEFIKDAVEDYGIHETVNNAVDKIVEEFVAMDVYKDWISDHNKWFRFDQTEHLQIMLASLKLLTPKALSWSMDKLKHFLDSDPCPKHAEELLKKNTDYLFCVMGHTHDPAHVPLFIGSDKKERHYLNSGTFREVFTQSLDGEHFIRHQRMSYVVIYGPNEFDGKNADPTYEMWNGLRARH